MNGRTTSNGGWSTRLAAIDLLIRVTRSESLESAVAASGKFNRLVGRDRAFARAIASAALRGRGRLDAAMSKVTARPGNRIDPRLAACLRVGAAQVFMLGTPAHAAVSATVEATRRWTGTKAKAGFVNAVLRRLTESPDLFSDQEDMSVWPRWLVRRLCSDLGEQRAAAMARLHLEPPEVDLTIREHPDLWAQRTGGQRIGSGVRLPSSSAGSLTELAGYARGAWWVQNAAAALAVPLFGDIVGKRVCDLCAAPGSKTAQLAAAGAEVTAIDISSQRLDRLRETLDRTGLSARIVCGDARQWKPEQRFAAVLVDAPCSGLGVARRHPEGIWQRRPRSDSYVRQAEQLLDAAYRMLEEDGQVVYCVCTPTAAEGRQQIDSAIDTGRWRRDRIRESEIRGFAYAVTEAGDVLTAPPQEYPSMRPDTFTGDVFFISRLRKLSV